MIKLFDIIKQFFIDNDNTGEDNDFEDVNLDIELVESEGFFNFLRENKADIVYDFVSEIIDSEGLNSSELTIETYNNDLILTFKNFSVDIDNRKRYYHELENFLTPLQKFNLENALTRREYDEAEKIIKDFREQRKDLIIADEELSVFMRRITFTVESFKDVNKIEEILLDILEAYSESLENDSEEGYFQIV